MNRGLNVLRSELVLIESYCSHCRCRSIFNNDLPLSCWMLKMVITQTAQAGTSNWTICVNCTINIAILCWSPLNGHFSNSKHQTVIAWLLTLREKKVSMTLNISASCDFHVSSMIYRLKQFPLLFLHAFHFTSLLVVLCKLTRSTFFFFNSSILTPQHLFFVVLSWKGWKSQHENKFFPIQQHIFSYVFKKKKLSVTMKKKNLKLIFFLEILKRILTRNIDVMCDKTDRVVSRLPRVSK